MCLFVVTLPFACFVSRVTHDRAGQTDWRAGAGLETLCSTRDWIIVRGDFKDVTRYTDGETDIYVDA
jgi:hypothetical protein